MKTNLQPQGIKTVDVRPNGEKEKPMVLLTPIQFHQYHLAGLPNSFTPMGFPTMKFYDKCPICHKKI